MIRRSGMVHKLLIKKNDTAVHAAHFLQGSMEARRRGGVISRLTVWPRPAPSLLPAGQQGLVNTPCEVWI